jgi:polar amino acid transport system substrate-binding protein
MSESASGDTAMSGDGATSEGLDPEVREALTPTGTLRAAINVGNTVLAQRAGSDATLSGVAVDIARALAQRLDVPLELVAYETAREVVEARDQERWDVGFMAADPKRRAEILFSPPYVLIEGHFVVRRESPIQSSAEVDRPGVRLALGAGTAYELYLSRHFRAAQLDRFPTTAIAFERFLQLGYDATAGVKEVAQAFVNSQPGLKLLPDRFMVIEQAVAIPSTRPIAAAYVAAFVEDLKRSGFIAASLQRSGQTAAVAPSC